ncbi:UNVERIFIED_CONTAM: Auxin-responsive protein SAUR36 [Sesamum angustifolium]|uniref:Auxin-responsive protein SAUR36 n=1 Tax=Sesamum angustifolium TaxID=2727405 RepID=A0AAW2MMP9_9LAMI
MGKSRGFRLGRKLVKVFKWCIHRRTRRRTGAYQRLKPSGGPVSKLCKWVYSLRRGARSLCSFRINSGYIPVGQDPVEQPKLPKGHLAVYVGDKEDDTCRVLVPVIYFNHPLFGELLREAEKVYGFNHPGGIQIPCPKSELESVQMKIHAAASGGGIWRRRKRS